MYVQQDSYIMDQWRTEGDGGFGVFNPTSPPKFGSPPKLCQINPIVKTVKKLLNLGSQHPKMFGKKGSKILKILRFAIVLH